MTKREAKKAHADYLEGLSQREFMDFVGMVGCADTANFRIAHIDNDTIPLGIASTIAKAVAAVSAISAARRIPIPELGIYTAGQRG